MNILQRLLLEADSDEEKAIEFLKKHMDWTSGGYGDFDPKKFKFENGTIHYEVKDEGMGLCQIEEIPFPIADIYNFGISAIRINDHTRISPKSLKNCPQKVERNCSIVGLKTTSMVGGPKWVGNSMDYGYNKFDSLDGLPEYVGYHLSLESNKITSFKDIHKKVKMAGKGYIVVSGNPAKSHLLDIMRIEGCSELIARNNDNDTAEFKKALEIISKHMGKGLKGITQAQRELLENDLDDFAE